MAAFDKYKMGDVFWETLKDKQNIFNQSLGMFVPVEVPDLTAGSTFKWGMQDSFDFSLENVATGTTNTAVALAQYTMTGIIMKRGKVLKDTTVVRDLNGEKVLDKQFADQWSTKLALNAQTDLAAILKGSFSDAATGETNYQTDLTGETGAASIITIAKIRSALNTAYPDLMEGEFDTLILHPEMYEKIMSDYASIGYNTADSIATNGVVPELGGFKLIKNGTLSTKTVVADNADQYAIYATRSGVFTMSEAMPTTVASVVDPENDGGTYKTGVFTNMALGIKGLSWIGSTGASPTVTELETGGNWSWLWDDTSQSRIHQFKGTISSTSE